MQQVLLLCYCKVYTRRRETRLHVRDANCFGGRGDLQHKNKEKLNERKKSEKKRTREESDRVAFLSAVSLSLSLFSEGLCLSRSFHCDKVSGLSSSSLRA